MLKRDNNLSIQPQPDFTPPALEKLHRIIKYSGIHKNFTPAKREMERVVVIEIKGYFKTIFSNGFKHHKIIQQIRVNKFLL